MVVLDAVLFKLRLCKDEYAICVRSLVAALQYQVGHAHPAIVLEVLVLGVYV